VSSAAKDGKSNVVVSVKSAKQKRKAGQTTAAELYEQTFGEDSRKKAKKGKKGK
jgi:N-acetyltransferase 10